jgi:hypothetical protein
VNRQEDKWWFSQERNRKTRSHVFLPCSSARIRAAREKAWERKDPGSLSILLSNPRWEIRLLRFLELSRVGGVMDDGVDEEARVGKLDRWIPWETEEWVVPRAPE